MDPTPSVDEVVVIPKKDKTNIGIAVLGVSVVILVIAFSVALIVMASNFTKRLDTNDQTIDKLEQIVVTQSCQLELAGDFYEGVGIAFGSAGVSQEGIAKIIDAGKRAASDSCS